MSEPVWKAKSVQVPENGWLYYEIEDHRGDKVEMSVVLDPKDGSIREVLITTARGDYMFFGNEAEAIFDFVEKELLGSEYWDDGCDIVLEVSGVDNS